MRSYFIIEKELSSIKCIQNVFEDFQEFNCVGISDQYDSSMNCILKETPSLVFINIDSAIENSFQFVNDLNLYSEDCLAFIAISSSKDKAYDVIKNGFYDFLLNPLTDLEIRKTILKFQKKNHIKKSNKICLKSYKDYRYLNTDEVLFLKADNNTTDFYMSDGSIVNSFKTLKTYENTLHNDFLRIHKSYIINRNHVSRIQFGKLLCSIKKNSHHIPFTKTYLDNVENLKNTLLQKPVVLLN